MKKHILLLGILLPLSAAAQHKIGGIVFIDSNGNGRRDSNEMGVKGVSVSDQVKVILTDQDGKYELINPSGYGMIMISTPDGYKTNGVFWKKVSTETQESIDFALVKTGQKKEFTFIHASDTHVSEKSIDRMEKLRKLIDESKVDFVIVTGDLVRDALRVPEKEASGYYQLYVDQIGKISSPVWNVPGNHENFGIERHLSLVSKDNPLYGKKMYHHFLGPNYYSFNYGGVHFIGLDDVDFEDTWYYGHVDSVQMNWIKEDLQKIPSTMPVVTFAHIPFFSGGLSATSFTPFGPGRTLEIEKGQQQFRHVVSNAHEFLSLFAKNNYPLNLTGHYHARQVYWYESTGQKIRFEQTGAVIGSAKERALEFPSGVTLYKVRDGMIDAGTFLQLD